MLGAIFTEKGIPRGDILELSKSDFVGILKDSGILILKIEDKKDDEDGKKKEYHFPCIDEDDDGYAYTLLATLKNQVFGKLSAQNQEIIGSVTEMKLFKVDTEVFDDSFFFIVHSVINNILLSMLGAKQGGSLCAHGN